MGRNELTTDELIVLERFVDATSLVAVLEGLAKIASDKADHIAASYSLGHQQPDPLSKQWDAAAVKLSLTARTPAVLVIS